MTKKTVKKTKFIDTSCVNYNKQPFYEANRNDNSQFNLVKNNYNNKEKLQVTLTNNFDPYNYNLNYFDSIKRTYTTENNYPRLYNQEAGRGFGNLNINNEIRKGDSGRIDSEDYKLYRESEVNNRFEFIDNRFNNPRNLVLPFPRLGDPTRKVTNFNTNPDLNTDLNTDEFLSSTQEMPNATIINDINTHNILEKQQQIDYMNKIRKLKEEVYYKGIKYKKELITGLTSSEPPSYRYDEVEPDDMRILGYIPSESYEIPQYDIRTFKKYNQSAEKKDKLYTKNTKITDETIDPTETLDKITYEIVEEPTEIVEEPTEIVEEPTYESVEEPTYESVEEPTYESVEEPNIYNYYVSSNVPTNSQYISEINTSDTQEISEYIIPEIKYLDAIKKYFNITNDEIDTLSKDNIQLLKDNLPPELIPPAELVVKPKVINTYSILPLNNYSSSEPNYSSLEPNYSSSSFNYSSVESNYSTLEPNYSSSSFNYSSLEPNYSSVEPNYSSLEPNYSSSSFNYSSLEPNYSSSSFNYSSVEPNYSSSSS